MVKTLAIAALAGNILFSECQFLTVKGPLLASHRNQLRRVVSEFLSRLLDGLAFAGGFDLTKPRSMWWGAAVFAGFVPRQSSSSGSLDNR